MASVKVHYGGWIALPAALREQLSLETGDTLEIERVEGGLLLRVPGGAAATGMQAAGEPSRPAPPPAGGAPPPARPRGRKPRNPAPPASGSMVLPPVLQGGRGRRRPKNQPAS